MPKVALCIPSGETWKAIMAFSMVCLAAHSTSAGIELQPINVRGGDAAENRNRMTQAGRENGADWFLYVDADMCFPSDSLIRLLKWDKDIVGADYRYKSNPFSKLGTKPDGTGQYPPDHVDPIEGLVERGMLGLGMLLVRASVIEKMPPPWFIRTWIPDFATPDNPYGFGTDDSFFCNYAHYHKFQVWCDMGLTQNIQHIGEAIVPWQMGKKKNGG
jgi:hypothetical protein